jgi:hypothetical protein
MFSEEAYRIFVKSIQDYHILDDVNQPENNPYLSSNLDHLLYKKNWIDTVQWHYEDLIRDPEIDPSKALELKRKIDASNQERTDLVEYIDSYFLNKYQSVQPMPGATLNTESPAWAIDRLSILALKIYHMEQEVSREDATQAHQEACTQKLLVLKEQRGDLSLAIDQLIEDIEEGRKYMKVYKQMKMYNDQELNPVLRERRS